MNNLTGNHFHEASIYNYTTIVLASFYYWTKWFLYTHCIYQLCYFWLRPYILLTRTQHTSRRQNFQEAFKSGLAAARTENKHFVIPKWGYLLYAKHKSSNLCSHDEKRKLTTQVANNTEFFQNDSCLHLQNEPFAFQFTFWLAFLYNRNRYFWFFKVWFLWPPPVKSLLMCLSFSLSAPNPVSFIDPHHTVLLLLEQLVPKTLAQLV